MATVVVTPEALKELERLPVEIVARVGKLLERLEAWPEVSGAKALSGNLAGHWRLRTGDYRVQFRIEGIDRHRKEGIFPGVALSLAMGRAFVMYFSRASANSSFGAESSGSRVLAGLSFGSM